MIYTLTNTIHNQISWQDIIYEQDYLDITNLYHNVDMEKYSLFGEYLTDLSNFDKITKLTKDDILLIDASYVMMDYNTNFSKEIIDKLSKLNCKSFIFSQNSIVTDLLNVDNVTIFSPAINNPYHGLLINGFNPGLVNTSHNKSYHTIDKILNELRDIPRYKKFNFIYDDLTPNGFFIYFLMNKFGILDDSMYTNPKIHTDDKITPNNDTYNFQNILINSFGQDVSHRISNNEFYEFINNLPNDSLKMKWNDTFKVASPYNMNTYVSIVPPTFDDNNNYQFASTTIFRPFLWKNIPLFIGSHKTQEVVKNYGFDLFEDIFDLPDDNCRGLDRVNNLFENIQKINNKSYTDLHNLYSSVNHRLENNFNLLRELGDTHINHLINLIIQK